MDLSDVVFAVVGARRAAGRPAAARRAGPAAGVAAAGLPGPRRRRSGCCPACPRSTRSRSRPSSSTWRRSPSSSRSWAPAWGSTGPPTWRGWSNTWRLLGIAHAAVDRGRSPCSAAACSGWPLPRRCCSGPPSPPPTRCSPARCRWASRPPTRSSADELVQAEDEVRFGLTSEAGLNDALAFPFVYAAIAMADKGTRPVGLARRTGWPSRSPTSSSSGCSAASLVGMALGRLFFSSRRAGAAAVRAQRGLRRAGRHVLGLRRSPRCCRATASWPCSSPPSPSAAPSASTATTWCCTTSSSRSSGCSPSWCCCCSASPSPTACSAASGAVELRSPASRCSSSARWPAGSPSPARAAPAASAPRWRSSASGGSARSTTWPTRWGRRPFTGSSTVWAVTALVVVGSVVVHGALAGPVMDVLDRRHARDRQERELVASPRP